MRTFRHLSSTPGRVGVTLALVLLLVAPMGRAEAADDQGVLLRRAARSDVPLSERLECVHEVLKAETLEAPEAAIRAGVSLLDEAPGPACWLLKRSSETAYVDDEPRAAVQAAIGARIEGERGDSLDPLVRAQLAAAGLLYGHRPELAPTWMELGGADDAFVKAVLELEGHPGWKHGAVHGLLDVASRDDLESSRRALDELVRVGSGAVPVLVHEARLAATRFVPGRRERATRAILALGFIRDRAATPVLIDAMHSSPDGWVRTYAATALGDMGDPYAVIALARQATLLGDPLRSRDQWEYPGSQNTKINESDWASTPYFVIDTGAADSMLRLGVRGAAGWLIHQQLDPRKKNHRIRVYQDATDAIKRSVPGAPIDDYNVDEGLPQREKAFEALATWWHEHKHDAKVLENELDPSDPRFHEAALGLADVLAGTSGVREMMMTNAAIDLLGPLMTRALSERAKNPQSPFHKAEIAQALGRVNDPNAIPALLEIVRDKTAFVRAKAATGLGPYARTNETVRGLLTQLIKSRNAAVRVAALQALVHAPRDAAVKKALDDWIDADRIRKIDMKWRTPDVEPALAVIRFVQEGESAWATVEEGLTHEQRVMRRTWWDLLRAALDVPEYLHDPVADPGTSWARTFTKDQALAALGGA